ncbi:MAG TPA: MarR family winged helix-turn-helix transcriptional regulator [Candidatus Angelobacter sp.]|jgi:DNA-binding MarR family transcriptional regulator|nr:MarR family winged helix-turn-helix transcriptional regulator [Candidatus Angelobacter sp.]
MRAATAEAAPAAGSDVQAQAAQLGRLAGRLRRALNRRVRAQVGGTPLPEAQLDVLRDVMHAPAPPRVQDVAARLRLAPNTVSTLVASLARAGLLARQSDADDGRAVRLMVTPQARRRIRAWQAHRAQIVAAHLDGLGETQRRALERALPALELLTASLEADD